MTFLPPMSSSLKFRSMGNVVSATIYIPIFLVVLYKESMRQNNIGSVTGYLGCVVAFENPRPWRQRGRRHPWRKTSKPDCIQTHQARNQHRLSMLPPLPPSFEYGDSVVFFQRATGTRISGRDELETSRQRWQRDFQEEVDTDNVDFTCDGNDENRGDLRSLSLPQFQTISATSTSPTTLLLRWSLTYVDPSIRWMLTLAETIPGWSPDFVTYTDKVSVERRFSYSALGKLFASAFATGKLRVPLACIEGTTVCEFEKETQRIKSMTEDLAYAQDLLRGAMSNRVCARDLQFFLETARKPPEYYRGENHRDDVPDRTVSTPADASLYWEDRVASCLPWKSVPGMMDPLYVEAQAEEDLAANLPLLFAAVSIGIVVFFASWIAPNIIGQSLFGSPTYIVPPSELNDIIGY